MIRPVIYQEGDAGIWDITCETCPLLPHAKALDAKPPKCMYGIATNMQGHILLGKCKHAQNGLRGLSGEGIDCQWFPA